MARREHNFKVGRLGHNRDISLQELYGELRNTRFSGDIGERKGVRRVNYSNIHEVLYFVFLKETERTIVSLDENNEDTMQDVYPLRSMKVMLGRNGTYVYESVQGISEVEAMEFVFGPGVSVMDAEGLSRSTMLNFYNNHLDRVKKFRIHDIGEREPNPGPIPQHIRRIIEEYGDIISLSEHSVGQQEEDAREDELAYGMAETSELRSVRGEDEEGRTEELTKSGIFRMIYDDEDMEPEEEATFITNKISNVFNREFDR